MRLRNKPWAMDRILAHPHYIVTNPENWRGRWHQRFDQLQDIYLEVGSGKGQFMVNMAKQNPQFNYIALEV